jgi:hypothetical protein
VTAVKWSTKAAVQGDAMAQNGLGWMYENGDGVIENHKIAVKWYTKAAEQGYAPAQANLGFMYENGLGVLKDYERAYMWLTIGANNGDDAATENKGVLGKAMTSEQLIKSQEMANRCLVSNYTDC